MLNPELLQRGLATLNAIDGAQGEAVMTVLADIAPDLGQYIIGFAFGEIYNRPALDLRQRELITLAALAAQGGCENQLRVHIHAARNVARRSHRSLHSLRAVPRFPESAECGIRRQSRLCR